MKEISDKNERSYDLIYKPEASYWHAELTTLLLVGEGFCVHTWYSCHRQMNWKTELFREIYDVVDI